MQKVIVILGPTASGKTSLGIELALKFNGEIISADSRQVYKGLDIGSGKVTKQETKNIPHHLIDIKNPGEYFSAMDFKREAENAIEIIRSKNKLPIIVGGTYFYIKTLLENYQMPEIEIDQKLRKEIETWSREKMLTFLEKESPEDLKHLDTKNPRKLQRAIEVVKITGKSFHSQSKKGPQKFEALKFAMDLPREELYKKIDTRVDVRWNGMKKEVADLISKDISPLWLKSLGLEYNFITKIIQGELKEPEAREKLKFAIHNFARKQLIWLRKDKELVWTKPDVKFIEKKVQNFIEIDK